MFTQNKIFSSFTKQTSKDGGRNTGNTFDFRNSIKYLHKYQLDYSCTLAK